MVLVTSFNPELIQAAVWPPAPLCIYSCVHTGGRHHNTALYSFSTHSFIADAVCRGSSLFASVAQIRFSSFCSLKLEFGENEAFDSSSKEHLGPKQPVRCSVNVSHDNCLEKKFRKRFGR